MGINVVQYRLAIGLFNHVKVKSVIFHCPLLYIICTSLRLILCYMVIFLLICSGDVEMNPGPDKLKFLRMCHINIRSLNTVKMLALKTICGQYDIITLSETHLDPNTLYEHLHLDGFHNIVRKDRARLGGGVAIFIRECIGFKRRLDLESNNIEAIWIQINTVEGKILLSSCYRPPNYSEFWDNFIVMIDKVKEDHIKYNFILGDLNADFNTVHGRQLKHFCDSNNFYIHNYENTRITLNTATVLDQLISNVPDFVRSVRVDPPLSTCDHSILSTVLNFKIKRDLAYDRLIWSYKNADFDNFRDLLSNADWDSCFEIDDVETANRRWCETFLSIARICIPNRVVKVRPSDSPWYTTELHRLKRKVNRSYANIKSNCTPLKWQKYLSTKDNYCKQLIKAEKVYNENLTESLGQERNSRKWWSTVKHLLGKGNDSSYPPLEHSDKYITDNKEKADVFNNFFISHSSIDDTHATLPLFSFLTNFRMNSVIAREDEIGDLLKTLNDSKATGHDGIGPKMLKQAGISVIPSLTRLINLSFAKCTVPSSWKKAQVIPIYKKDNKSDPNNYRPVSILPTISKIAERIVFKHVFNYFRDNNLLTKHQSCVPGDSTVNQLVYLYNAFSKALDDKKDVQLVFCDIKKAFDKVWHQGIIFKLKQLGITGNLLGWFEDYLNGRLQRVGIKGQNSDWVSIQAGVPQGSVLGPLLFMVYINDIVDNISCDIKLYADDTTLYIVTDNLENGTSLLNSDLEMISRWSKTWLVTFCPNKTEYMHVTHKNRNMRPDPPSFQGEILREVEHHKHLGITFSSNLTWNKHISNISKSVSKSLDAMKKLKYTTDRKTLYTIYTSFIRPKLEYGSIIWNDCNQNDGSLLEGLQLDAARIITGAKRGTSHNKIYIESGLETLTCRRENSQLIQFYKMMHNKTPTYLTNLTPTSVGESVNIVKLRNNDKLRGI